MSFFYDLNKKLDSIRATPEVTHQQLNERDLGKHNNATTGFAALAKKTGGGEKGARIAGAQLAKMRAKGQVEEDFPNDYFSNLGRNPTGGNQAGPSAITPDYDNYNTPDTDKIASILKRDPAQFKNPIFHSAMQGAASNDAQGQNRYVDRTEPGIINKIKDKLGYDMPDPAYGPKPDERERLAKRHPAPMKEGGWNPVDEPVAKSSASKSSSSKKYDPNIPGSGIIVGPDNGPPPKKTDDRLYKDSVPVDDPVKKTTNEGGVVDPVGEIRPGQRTPVRPSNKPEVKRLTPLPKPSGATDDESMTDEGAGVMHFKDQQAKAAGKKTFTLGDETFPVKEAAKWRNPEHKGKLYTQEPLDHTFGPDMDAAYYNDYPDDYAGRKQPMASGNGDPLRKGFGRGGAANSINTHGKRKGLPSRDQITSLKGSIKDASGTHAPAKFADAVGRAKKEVDEMLGNVAADAMKKAVGGGRGRNAEMDEASDWSQLHKPFNAGHFNDTPTRRRSSTGGEIDTSKSGVTVHTQVKGNYSGAAHSGEERRAAARADAADERGPRAGRRTVGAGNGTRIGANSRGTSKLANKPAIGASGKPKSMTKENDQDPADQGEYGREGEMGRNEIHTMMRNAKQLEKMLGNNDDLPEWVQKKLSLASDYMQTIADYLASEKETDAEDQTGREVEVELAEKKSVRSKPKLAKRDYDNDGKRETGPEEHAGSVDNAIKKSKKSKPFAKKEEEVEESTTSGSVATASTSGKASKGGMSFGKGIYDSIDRAVERQINESMNISMNMSTDEHGGPGQSLTITATDEDAVQLAQLLKMAGMGGGEAETCSTCGMTDCGCGDMEQMDETYGDNKVDMNHPNYPTNTEIGSLKTALTGGGLNKQKASGMATIPVTDVNIDGDDRFARSAHYDDFQESIKRMREIAGIKEEGSLSLFTDPKDIANRLGLPGKSIVDQLPKSDSGTGGNRAPADTNTFLDPAQKAQRRLARQNESIFTDTANLWKRYKG